MIKRLYIENFGGIKDKEIFLDSGLNIIHGKNESGKTTVCAFIRAMLYGVDTERKRDIRGNMRKRYTPLDGSVMAGVLETDEYVVRRIFGASAKFDTCNAVNKNTGEVIPMDEIGYTLMGMNEMCFCNTFYMNSFDSYPTSEEELMTRLANAGDTGDEGVSYDKVVAALDDMVRPYTKRSGIVEKTLEDARTAQQNYENEKQKRANYEELKISHDMLIEKRKEAEGELKKLETSKEKLAEQTVELRNKQRELFEEIVIDTHEDSEIRMIPAIASVVFAIIGFLFVFSYKNPMFLLCIGAFIPMIICIKMSGFIGAKENDKRSTADMQLAVIEKIMQKTGVAESTDVDDKIKKVNDFLIECAERTGRVESELGNISFDEEAKQRAINAKAEYERAVEERDCINVARFIISQIYDEMKCDFMPDVNKDFSKYFSRLTGGEYIGAAADREMNISVINSRGAEKWEYLSGGTLDGAYFALRLSLCDRIDKDNTATMIIDDAFLQYDDERVKNTVQIISEMQRQTIYFTCRDNIGNLKCKLIKI